MSFMKTFIFQVCILLSDTLRSLGNTFCLLSNSTEDNGTRYTTQQNTTYNTRNTTPNRMRQDTGQDRTKTIR